jgi:hypothetical protein
MQHDLKVMNIALKVLTSLSYQREPDPRDVAELELYAGIRPVGLDLEEFTCQVLHQALQNRANARAGIM